MDLTFKNFTTDSETPPHSSSQQHSPSVTTLPLHFTSIPSTLLSYTSVSDSLHSFIPVKFEHSYSQSAFPSNNSQSLSASVKSPVPETIKLDTKKDRFQKSLQHQQKKQSKSRREQLRSYSSSKVSEKIKRKDHIVAALKRNYKTFELNKAFICTINSLQILQEDISTLKDELQECGVRIEIVEKECEKAESIMKILGEGSEIKAEKGDIGKGS